MAYVAAQFVGMFIGALLAFMFLHNGGNLVIDSNKFVFQAMVMEALCSFLFVLIFLI